MNDSPREETSLAEKAEAALQEAVREVVENARRTGGTLVVWKDGAVVELSGDQLPASRGAAPVSSQGRKPLDREQNDDR